MLPCRHTYCLTCLEHYCTTRIPQHQTASTTLDPLSLNPNQDGYIATRASQDEYSVNSVDSRSRPSPFHTHTSQQHHFVGHETVGDPLSSQYRQSPAHTNLFTHWLHSSEAPLATSNINDNS
ncbi:unnamed protein product, partial [Protopolystoma xenopodis]